MAFVDNSALGAALGIVEELVIMLLLFLCLSPPSVPP